MVTQSPLDDVEFLARSAHRVRVLETLARGPRIRSDLHEETGVPQPTLGRVLGSFEDRGWIERRGQEYALTPFGGLLAEEFEDLLDTVETMQRFREVAPYLPLDELPFDIRLFGEARITLPQTSDVLAHVRRSETLLAEADRVRVLSPSIFPAALRELLDRLRVRGQRHEAILTAGAIDGVLSDPELVASTRDLLEIEGIRVFRYEGSVPLMLGIADGTAIIGPLDEHDLPRALIEAESEPIRSWVEARLDDYREGATSFTLEDLPD